MKAKLGKVAMPVLIETFLTGLFAVFFTFGNMNSLANPSANTTLAIIVAFFVLVFLSAERTGANLNPAVTLTIFATEKLRKKDKRVVIKTGYLLMIIGQMLGAFVGSLIARFLIGGDPSARNMYPMSSMSIRNTCWGIMLAELLGTTSLCLMTAFLHYKGGSRFESAIAMSATLMLSASFFGDVSGGVFNPALSFSHYLSGVVINAITGNTEYAFNVSNPEHPHWEAFKTCILYYMTTEFLAFPLSTLFCIIAEPKSYKKEYQPLMLDDFSDLDDLDEEAEENTPLTA